MKFVRSLAPKTMKQRLEEAKSEADAHNRQREMPERGKVVKNRQWQHEM